VGQDDLKSERGQQATGKRADNRFFKLDSTQWVFVSSSYWTRSHTALSKEREGLVGIMVQQGMTTDEKETDLKGLNWQIR
jgi:hypothetical protein